jgi:hypothetical protein
MRPMKKVAILQSNYIPWRGYFDLIAYADEFILFDNVQYTRRDWRNRNQIKTPRGREWITIPVSSDRSMKICDVPTMSDEWRQKHWRTLEVNYSRAAYFREVSAFLEPLYLEQNAERLSEINEAFIRAICHYLGITTPITHSTDYELVDGKSERILGLCQQSGATTYVSGPAAKTYLDEPLFAANRMELEWFHYEGFSEYPQLWGPFDGQVSIVDLLMNCGTDAPKYLRHA